MPESNPSFVSPSNWRTPANPVQTTDQKLIVDPSTNPTDDGYVYISCAYCYTELAYARPNEFFTLKGHSCDGIPFPPQGPPRRQA